MSVNERFFTELQTNINRQRRVFHRSMQRFAVLSCQRSCMFFIMRQQARVVNSYNNNTIKNDYLVSLIGRWRTLSVCSDRSLTSINDAINTILYTQFPIIRSSSKNRVFLLVALVVPANSHLRNKLSVLQLRNHKYRKENAVPETLTKR